MDVIGRAATLYRKRGFQAVLFHVISEDDIHVIDERGAGDVERGSTFASGGHCRRQRSGALKAILQ
jgi:hypothetical protein